MAKQPEQAWTPTKQQLLDARNELIPDLLQPGLDVIFIGINPGLYSAAVKHHFARPGNRFWPALHRGGFTPRLFSAFEEHELLALGCGMTNIVPRATAAADELEPEELLAGGIVLERKLRKYRPRFAAVLGVTAYRTAFQRPKAKLGEQPESIAESRLWILPSPSGLNAHYQLADLGKLFAQLREAVLTRADTNTRQES